MKYCVCALLTATGSVRRTSELAVLRPHGSAESVYSAHNRVPVSCSPADGIHAHHEGDDETRVSLLR